VNLHIVTHFGYLTSTYLSDNYNINHQQINEQLHPVHPQILDILIQTENPRLSAFICIHP